MINDKDVAMVLEKTDILSLIGEHVSLKRVGLRYVGLCPFHSENTPSFSVNAEEGFYYCFGCHASGDSISFVRDVERMDFVQAVEFLASRAGVTLNYDSEEGLQNSSKRSALQSAMVKAVDFYHDNLLRSVDGKGAREYLNSRGIGPDLWQKFRLGWAPDLPHSLYDAIKVEEKIYVDAGLGYLDHNGHPIDQMRSRIIFPIFDVSGKPIALGARILPPEYQASPGRDGPKYKNTPETALYSKRKTLYGLNLAKARIVAQGEIIICEGYTDVIAFFCAGMERAVASCGTALTEEHFAKIKSFSRRIVLAFDADGAGASATDKFYSWERKHNLEIYVADMPKGMDPGELGLRDPERLRSAVSNAMPFMTYRLKRLYDGADMTSIEGRARLADQAIEVISEHPNVLVRNDYLMQLADKARFEIGDLHIKLEESLYRRKSQSSSKFAEVSDGDQSHGSVGLSVERSDSGRSMSEALGLSDRPALEGLKMLIHNLNELSEFFPLVLFTHPTHRSLRIALMGATQIAEAATRVELAGQDAKELFIRLAVDAPKSDPFDVVSRLVERAVNRRLELMTQQAKFLESNSEKLVELSTELSKIRLLQDKLRSGGKDKIESTGQLLFWLVNTEHEEL